MITAFTSNWFHCLFTAGWGVHPTNDTPSLLLGKTTRYMFVYLCGEAESKSLVGNAGCLGLGHVVFACLCVCVFLCSTSGHFGATVCKLYENQFGKHALQIIKM